MSSSAVMLGIEDTFLFHHDHDPKHRTKEWMLYNIPRQLETPPQSSIEYLWYKLDFEVGKNELSSKK